MLWYDRPAPAEKKRPWLHENPNYTSKGNPDKDWEKYALPIGNGSLGAMIYGSIAEERIQFNEKTVWSGGPGSKYFAEGNTPEAWKSRKKLQELILAGKDKDKKEIKELSKNLCGSSEHLKGAKKGEYFGSYMTFGEIYIKTGIIEANVKDYRRELNLETGTVTVTFSINGKNYKREYFVSYPDNVIVMRFIAEQPQNLNLEVATPHKLKTSAVGGKMLLVDGKLKSNGLELASAIVVLGDGKNTFSDKGIAVSGGKDITFILSADTAYVNNYPDYRGVDPVKTTAEWLKNAEKKGVAGLTKSHLKDYKQLYDRVKLNLDAKKSDLPTDQRVLACKKGAIDNGLIELFYNFGRYLLISSSRPGNLPANLQGIWCNEVVPAWFADYHLNINLQMNYWPAETANLSECHIPLIDYTDSLRAPGANTAKAYFNARGWTSNLHSNPWGFTAPSPGGGPMFWKFFPLSGAWLCQHVWEHYVFTQDKSYLKNKAYPILKSQAEFLQDYLIKDNDGKYISCPSWSPEHGPMSRGTTTDHQMARQALYAASEVAEILGVDSKESTQWKEIAKDITPNLIGKFGQLQEWKEDIDKKGDKHRHTNHLFGLFPGNEISPVTTPELAKAARVSLESRGDRSTGWSMGWKINYWARLKDGNRTLTLIRLLLKHGTSTNLFDLHPPFQIDGNFGAVSGINEMLLQSHTGYIEILPALSDDLPNGSVSGLCARGGFELSFTWEKGDLKDLSITSKGGKDAVLLYNGKIIKVKLKKGETKKFSGKDFINQR